jgi:hypothetical protein
MMDGWTELRMVRLVRSDLLERTWFTPLRWLLRFLWSEIAFGRLVHIILFTTQVLFLIALMASAFDTMCVYQH